MVCLTAVHCVQAHTFLGRLEIDVQIYRDRCAGHLCLAICAFGEDKRSLFTGFFIPEGTLFPDPLRELGYARGIRLSTQSVSARAMADLRSAWAPVT